MAKRFKVIADYPGNLLEVGSVLELQQWNSEKYEFKYMDDNEEYYYLSESTLQRCDKNFRALSWYEEREESDMPKYLKYATYKYSPPFVVYPAKFIKEKNGWTVKVDNHIIPHGNYLNDKLPATKEEYDQYINKQS